MSLNLQISYDNGKSDYIRVSPSDKIGDVKKTLSNQEDAVWKWGNSTLKNTKTFGDYEFDDNDIIYSNQRNKGGKNY